MESARGAGPVGSSEASGEAPAGAGRLPEAADRAPSGSKGGVGRRVALLFRVAATGLYLLAFLPSFPHRQALGLHLGFVAALVLLWASPPRFGLAFRLKTLLFWLGAGSLVAVGFFNLRTAEHTLLREIDDVRFQRLGLRGDEVWNLPPPGEGRATDPVGRDCDRAAQGEPEACERITALVQDERPGWSRGLAVMGRILGMPGDSRALEAPQLNVCGNPFLTPLGYDRLASLKSVLRLEERALAKSQDLRIQVLAEWDRRPSARPAR